MIAAQIIFIMILIFITVGCININIKNIKLRNENNFLKNQNDILKSILESKNEEIKSILESTNEETEKRIIRNIGGELIEIEIKWGYPYQSKKELLS